MMKYFSQKPTVSRSCSIFLHNSCLDKNVTQKRRSGGSAPQPFPLALTLLKLSGRTSTYAFPPQTPINAPVCQSTLKSRQCLNICAPSHVAPGVREKKIVLVNVKVYAVAFYVGDRGIHKLGPWRRESAEQLKKDENFYKLLSDGEELHHYTYDCSCLLL
jgi:hypothetical protein